MAPSCNAFLEKRQMKKVEKDPDLEYRQKEQRIVGKELVFALDKKCSESLAKACFSWLKFLTLLQEMDINALLVQ